MTDTRWMPAVGSVIPAHLPQEIVRAEVLRYIGPDELEVHLNVQPPMAKAHSYRFKQKVLLRRHKAQPSGDKWLTEDAEENYAS